MQQTLDRTRKTRTSLDTTIMKKPKPKFHPNAPMKLKRLWKIFSTYHAISKYLDVNISYIYNALIKGKLPTNQNVRIKFGLPRKPRKPRTAGTIKTVKTSLPNHL